MSTVSWQGSDLASWQTSTNWIAGSVPITNIDSPQFTFSVATAARRAVVYNPTGGTWTLGSGQKYDVRNSATNGGNVGSLYGTGAGDTSNVMVLANNSTITTDWTATPELHTTSGVVWRCWTHGSAGSTVNKTANAFLCLRGPVSISSALAVTWNVTGGYLVYLNDSSFGVGPIRLAGTATGISPHPTEYTGGSALTLQNALYLTADTNSIRIGSYYDAWNPTTPVTQITVPTVVMNGSTPKTLNIRSASGGNVTFNTFYSETSANRCGFTKAGPNTLTLAGSVPGGNFYIRGDVVVSAGAGNLVVNSVDVLQEATLLGNERMTWGQAAHNLGNIASGSPFAVGGKTFNTGYANEAATYSGQFSGSGTLIKQGTGTWTLSGDNSGFSGSWGFYAGSVLATTSSNALGGPGRTHDVQTTGQIQVASGHTVNNTGGTTYLRRTATDKGALYAASGTADYTTGTVYLGVAQTPVEAAFGATLNVTASSVVSELSNHGLYKLGAGTVVLSSSSYTYTGSTTVAAGTLSATGSALGATPVALGDARLLNTQLGASTSLTIPTAFTTQATVESSVTSPDYANAVTIPTSSALTLKTENLAGGRPIPLLGTAPLNVNGALVAPIGSNQRGRLVHGGNLAFGAGSLLRFSTPTAPTTIGTQSVTGDLQLDAATPVVMDASTYTTAGTYTLFRWTGAFSYTGSYANAQAAVSALLNVTPPVNPLLELTSGPTYVYGLNRIDVTLAAISDRGRQSITGDFDLAVGTSIVLDAGVYNEAGKYCLFSWTGNFLHTGIGGDQAAVDARLNVTHPTLAVSAVTYNGTTKSITVTLS